eukprot:GHVN01009817.1.p3 GENE.GHVN01009817.1~~GHVN01009817.1.p3  ORF type:complete len:107 (-),score=9.89 GHVN01009817.1:253-573(-)
MDRHMSSSGSKWHRAVSVSRRVVTPHERCETTTKVLHFRHEIDLDKDKERSVLEILTAKQPHPTEPRVPKTLTATQPVTVSAAHNVAAGRSMKGSARPCGMDAFLL